MVEVVPLEARVVVVVEEGIDDVGYLAYERVCLGSLSEESSDRGESILNNVNAELAWLVEEEEAVHVGVRDQSCCVPGGVVHKDGVPPVDW